MGSRLFIVNRTRALFAAAALALMLSGATGFLAISSSSEPQFVTFYACKDDRSGSLTSLSVDDVPACGFRSTLVSWISIDPGSLDDVYVNEGQPDAISTGMIQSGAVTNDELANSSVSTDKLQDGSVVEIKLADGSVTTAKIADGNVTTEKLADQAVTNDKLQDGSVSDVKLQPDSVSTDKLQFGSVSTDKIASESITEDKLAENSVSSMALQPDSVLTEHILDHSVTSDKLDDQSVATIHLVDEAVSSSKVAPDSITTGHLVNNSVNAAKINDNEVQRRITDACDPGEAIRSVDQVGDVTCQQVPPAVDLIVLQDEHTIPPNSITTFLSTCGDGYDPITGGVERVDGAGNSNLIMRESHPIGFVHWRMVVSNTSTVSSMDVSFYALCLSY